jgi:coenzyme F420-0:L-glutamate ligase / coenzyme F420-1:gamma-L-glutamate ligase
VRTQTPISQSKSDPGSTLRRNTSTARQGREHAAQGASRGWRRRKEKARQGRKTPPPSTHPELHIIPLPVAGEVIPGTSLTKLLLSALQRQNQHLGQGDILVIKHKIVSKAEGQFVDLRAIRPSAASRRWARRYHLDPGLIELALTEACRIVRQKRGVLITETRHGLILANSGVDVSNVDGGRRALLLPENPDRSAAQIHAGLKKTLRLSIPVIISDTCGRPWREGLTEVAIGVAGMKALRDFRGRRDPSNYTLRASVEAVADELACAAGLVCGKLNRTPACIIRGLAYQPGRSSARELLRRPANDLFR